MSCTLCKHYRQKRGHQSGLMECARLAGLVACPNCNHACEIFAWKYSGIGKIRCPKCDCESPVPADDSPLIGFLGISTDPPPWCPGFEAIEAPKKRTKPDPQRTLF